MFLDYVIAIQGRNKLHDYKLEVQYLEKQTALNNNQKRN